MKKTYILLGLLIASATCFSQDWVEVYEDDDLRGNIHISSMKISGDVVYVWFEEIYHGYAFRENFINHAIELDTPISASKIRLWNNFYYTMEYMAFDCSKRALRSMETIYYTKSGQTIIHQRDEKILGGFRRVVPDSRGEFLLNFVCSYKQ